MMHRVEIMDVSGNSIAISPRQLSETEVLSQRVDELEKRVQYLLSKIEE